MIQVCEPQQGRPGIKTLIVQLVHKANDLPTRVQDVQFAMTVAELKTLTLTDSDFDFGLDTSRTWLTRLHFKHFPDTLNRNALKHKLKTSKLLRDADSALPPFHAVAMCWTNDSLSVHQASSPAMLSFLDKRNGVKFSKIFFFHEAYTWTSSTQWIPGDRTRSCNGHVQVLPFLTFGDGI